MFHYFPHLDRSPYVDRKFKLIHNGVTYRKSSPHDLLDGKTYYRADALVVKDGCVVEQFTVDSVDKPLGAEAMLDLRRSSWDSYKFHVEHNCTVE